MTEARDAARVDADGFWEEEKSNDAVLLFPTTEESLFKWTAFLHGPEGTPYEDGVFQLQIHVGKEYPIAPPQIWFRTRIIHPNIHLESGEVCLDILKAQWTPAWSLEAACRAIIVMLSHPEADSPLNCDAGNLIRSGDVLGFNTLARCFTAEHANPKTQRKVYNSLCL